MKVCKFWCATFIGIFLFVNSHFTYAQIVTDKVPLLTYAETSVPVYDEPNGTKKGVISMGTSLVMVKIIRDDGWAYGSYKIGNRKKRVNRWFRMSDLQGYLDFENYTDSASRDAEAYRTRSSSNLVGRVSSNEEITVVAKRGEKLKIIFLADGNKYRMGWVDSTIFIKPEVYENNYNSPENNSYDDGAADYSEYSNYENSENYSSDISNEVNTTNESSTVANHNAENNNSENHTDEDSFESGDFESDDVENSDFENTELDNSEYDGTDVEKNEPDVKNVDKEQSNDLENYKEENVSDDK